jgi:hypothetical protein
MVRLKRTGSDRIESNSDYNPSDMKRLIEEESKKQNSKGLSYQIIRIGLFLTIITTAILTVLAFTDFSCFWDTTCQVNKLIYQQVFFISLILLGIIGFVFFFFIFPIF